MKYINGAIKKYLKDLSSRTPAPGGGSAAALSSGMAAGLVAMACQFTIGKDKYKRFEPRAKVILKRSLKIQDRLGRLLDEDVDAYLRKDMERAVSVPAEVCRLSYEIMGFAVELLERGSKNLATDAGLAVLLSETGFLAGFSYVRVNKAQKGLIKKLGSMLKKVKALRKKAEVKLGYSA